MSGTLTRRQVGLLLCGGLAAASCASAASRVSARTALRTRPHRNVALPAPTASTGIGLEEALRRRHSVRSFTTEPVSDAEIAQLLWAAQGQTRSWGGRTAPSAGALYPLDLYALTPGRVWHYIPASHRAHEWTMAKDLRPTLQSIAMDQPAIGAAPLIVVVAATTARTAGKYGARATRYVALEAGHCTQNLLLEAVALGLGAVSVGAFTDADVQAQLGLAPGEVPHYLVAVGHPTPGA